jgi:hypothetical protein
MNDKIKKAATLTDSDSAPQEILPQAPCATSVAHDLKAADIREDKVTDKELIEMMRTQYAVTSSSYSLFHRDKNNLAVIYDEMVDRFRDQHLAGEKREGKPTLREAFEQAGWNYNGARKFRQRHENEKNPIPVYESSPKPLRLTAGDLIKDEDGVEGIASLVHESADKVDFTYKRGDEAVTETRPVYDGDGEPLFAKVKPAVRKVKRGDLFLFEDEGAEYEYKGDGKFARTETPTLLQQKRQADAVKLQEKKDRDAAKATEKKALKERRAAEAARRDLDKIAANGEGKKKKKAAKAAAPQSKTDQPLTTKAGDKSGPTAHGFFHELRLHEKMPYVVRDLNHPNLGILCECKDKADAKMKVATYEREAAAAA